MRAVVYRRVSSQAQAESGAGLDAQEDACMAFAVRSGWEVCGDFADEGVSGGAPLDKRPGLADALGAIGPGDVLLVARRDRLGRDPLIVAMIEGATKKRGGRIVSAAGEGTDDDSPTSVLMRRIVDAFAEYEKLLIQARTRAALAAKKRRGERTGTLRYGKRVDPADPRRSKGDRPAGLVDDPAEAEVLALVAELRAEGRGARSISNELNRRKVPTRGGGPWRSGTIARWLKNPQALTPNPEARP